MTRIGCYRAGMGLLLAASMATSAAQAQDFNLREWNLQQQGPKRRKPKEKRNEKHTRRNPVGTKSFTNDLKSELKKFDPNGQGFVTKDAVVSAFERLGEERTGRNGKLVCRRLPVLAPVVLHCAIAWCWHTLFATSLVFILKM